MFETYELLKINNSMLFTGELKVNCADPEDKIHTFPCSSGGYADYLACMKTVLKKVLPIQQ